MKKLSFFLVMSALLLTGCSMTTGYKVEDKSEVRINNYSDLSVCGEYPNGGDGEGGTNRYFVCRDSQDGNCYYKKAIFKDKEGCEYNKEEYPYGKPECMEEIYEFYNENGKSLENNAQMKANDNCEATTQGYFESVVQ